MANLYVRSTDGSDADNGSTWALAKATVAGAAAIDAAGDAVYVSQAHAESSASLSAAWAGTNANPVRILGASDSAEPPTATSTAPTITVTGTSFSWGGAAYIYGLQFVFSSSSSLSANFNSTDAFIQRYERCTFSLTGAGAGSILNFGAGSISAGNVTTLKDCSFRTGATGQAIQLPRDVIVSGGRWLAAGTYPTGVFLLGGGGRPSTSLVEAFDFSALPSTVNLVKTINDGGCRILFRNCRLPASWTGALVTSGQMKLGTRVEMHNCDNADTNYRLWIEDYGGSIKQETTVVRSGGASDGSTALSWRMVSNSNVAYPLSALASPEIVRWNAVTGSAITVTVELLIDGVTLTDAECWLELQYLGTSGVPLALVSSGMKAILASAANLTSSSATWTTTGLSSPVKLKVSATVTPTKAGFLHAVLRLAKTSTTVYIDPKLTVA